MEIVSDSGFPEEIVSAWKKRQSNGIGYFTFDSYWVNVVRLMWRHFGNTSFGFPNYEVPGAYLFGQVLYQFRCLDTLHNNAVDGFFFMDKTFKHNCHYLGQETKATTFLHGGDQSRGINV
ncbi:hypothetical protein HAX54_009358 [Datura stramonium]|uniref:Uncharacterized protein n=1 Tax=Datura stramonium TaxID=4076 RepID=A0ABS8WXF3_DATST|nr:hypothetical protein [Datura stramonium]